MATFIPKGTLGILVSVACGDPEASEQLWFLSGVQLRVWVQGFPRNKPKDLVRRSLKTSSQTKVPQNTSAASSRYTIFRYVVCRKRNLTCPRAVSWFINQAQLAERPGTIDGEEHYTIPQGSTVPQTLSPRP